MNIQIGGHIVQGILFLSCLLIPTFCATYTYSPCTSSAYLNTANLQCVNCATNQIANSYQIIPISCQCSPGYTLGTNGGSCTAAFTSSCSVSNSYYPIYNLDGSMNSGSTNCLPCSNSGYVNGNGTACTPCGPGMTYSPTQGCTCTATRGCFQSTISPAVTSSSYSTQLKYLIPGCATFGDYLSCSQIINLCVYSQAVSSTPECQFFSTYSLTAQLYASTGVFALTPTQSSAINIKLVSFSSTGNYLGEKALYLQDLMRCGVPSNAQIGITFGTNIQASCSFDFNNLVTQMQGYRWQGRLYQMLVQGDTGSYYDVPVYMPAAAQPVRRFFLEDSYTAANKINVLTSFTLQFTFANGQLTSPSFSPTYTLLSTQAGAGVVGQSSQLALSFNVQFGCDLSGFWTGAIASFVVISVAAMVHTGVKTYIGYLNRKSALLFFSNFAGVYSMWLFYYLLCMSGYWFLFTKATSSPYILLPVTHPGLYGVFYALVGIMVLLRLVWSLMGKADKLATEVYMINWEKGQFRNSWRQIFIVNSLAQFYTYRTVSLFWMLAVVLFFMSGVGWQNLAAATTAASSSGYYQTLTPRSRILLYFLDCAVFLAVGIIFKLLRRLSVLFWPYPFEDFVDYCTVANISFVFIKKRSPHAFYLHAALPERMEVTYRQINNAIRRGLQKVRSVGNEITSAEQLKLYGLYLSRDMEEKHTLMLKRVEDQEHAKLMKYSKQPERKQRTNLREEFVEGRLKNCIREMGAGSTTKSFFQSFCGVPPVDLRQEGARGSTSVYVDEGLELVSEVFPNGNEFEEIHTIIVIFLGWATLTNSSPIAAFLTYLVDQYIIGAWVAWSCRNNLQQMTRVKRGFMI